MCRLNKELSLIQLVSTYDETVARNTVCVDLIRRTSQYSFGALWYTEDGAKLSYAKRRSNLPGGSLTNNRNCRANAAM